MRSLALFTSLFCLCLAAVASAEPSSVPAELLADAELASVCFVNADEGWVVGDRGVIRATNDGGRSWRQQLSPVTCRLESVHFLNAETGWAVGGWTHPYTHRTSGVVLRTRDGGNQWTAITGSMLPGLKFVRFTDAKNGWAVGERSALYPTGVFWSDDAGRTWVPVVKGTSPGWVSADLRPDNKLLLAGSDGSIAEATRGEVKTLSTPDPAAGRTNRIRVSSRGTAWRVGDAGLLQMSNDTGHTWQVPVGMATTALGSFDLRGLATLGPHCWIAGAPGTFIFHSADEGKTWERFSTEQLPPLCALAFSDDQRGWAVGTFGLILATKDGGRTWRMQQQGGSRAAVLSVFATAERVPWEWTAQYGGNDGYLSVLEVLGREPQSVWSQTTKRLQEATVAVGGSHGEQAWQFPLPGRELRLTSDEILAAWNASEKPNSARAEEYLVRKIRQWQPDVILTEDVSPRGENPLAHATNQLVLAAVRKAAEAGEYPSQTERLGLKPWKVRKVAVQLAADRRGTLTLTTSQLAPRLGRSVGELAEGGRSLFSEHLEQPPVIMSANLLIDHLPQGAGRQDLMSGLSIRPGTEARRKLSDAVGGSLDALSRMTQRRHNVQQMIARTQVDSPQAATWLGQVNELTQGMSERASGDVLYQLAVRYQQAGKPELAAEALTGLLDRRVEHPLSESAALWLVRYYASSEAAWRLRDDQRYSVQVTSFEAPTELNKPAGTDDETEPLSPRKNATTAHAKQEGLAANGGLHATRAARALVLAKFIEKTQPALAAEPMLKFPLAAAERSQPAGSLKEYSAAPPTAPLADAWTAPNAAERWLLQQKGEPPVAILRATPAKAPVLDGRLDDEVWQLARGTALKGADKEAASGAGIVFARDERFLYIAASCRRSAKENYTVDHKPRVHDADLRQTDRISISLDCDRDYTTAYRLTVDHNGRVAEDCWGDGTWNPTWFVASDGNEEFWTFEAAIAWEELGPRAPTAKDVWAVDVERIIPTGDGQRLSPTAESNRPDRFGLLLFE